MPNAIDIDDTYTGPSFYWYDLETSGTNPRWDRIVQFAGIRTDLELNEVGGVCSTYVNLPEDVLPNPDASLVTGITPQLTWEQGIGDWQAMSIIEQLLGRPGTCGVGYNSLRFDDEFVRYSLYRTLFDPYVREWQNGNSRWDLIDLVRATGALRPDGIHWPTLDDLPSFKLELMTQANNLDHGNAHDAMSDVRATIAVARLIREKQPKLFKFYFDNRSKKQARRLLEPYGARLCVHVSGMYPRARYCLAPVMSLCRHPTNTNSIVVADLSQDIEPLLSMTAEEIGAQLFTRGTEARPPLKEVRINRCPFVAGIEVLTDENVQRLGIDMKLIESRRRRLQQPGLAKKLARVYGERPNPSVSDPDAALYSGFLKDEDRARCLDFRVALGGDGRPDAQPAAWPGDMRFDDARLTVLQARLKARSFPQFLNDEERTRWQTFVDAKLNDESGEWLALADLFERLNELDAEQSMPSPVLADLRAHAERLGAKFPGLANG